MDALYASDFGSNSNGLLFQDGTGEQDLCLTELLDEVFNNQDECSGEESTSQKNLILQNEMHLSGNTCPLQTVPPENAAFKENGTYGDGDPDIAPQLVKEKPANCCS